MFPNKKLFPDGSKLKILCTYERKHVFSEEKKHFKFETGLDLNKCIKQI